MADLMETLMADPKFLSGLTLLGGANPRNAPLQQAAAMMMQMNQAKQKQANDKIKLEQEAMQTQLYGQQIEQSKAKLAHDVKTQEQQDRIMAQGMEMLKSSGYLGGTGQPQQPEQPPDMPQPQGGMQPPAPQQLMQPQGMPQQPQGQQQPKPPQAAHLDFFDQRIPKQESGGKQFDPKTGLPLTSPKGAVGIAQIMPSTAPEAAQLAGMEWKPDVFNRKMTGDPTIDAETMNYNRVLGKAYFDKQFKDFGGRIDYASAAYNAGPQRVQTAITAATKANHPDIWTAFLPPETQKYLKDTGASSPSTSAQPPAPPTSPLGLRKPPDPRVGLAIIGGLAQGPKGFGDISKALEDKYQSPGSIKIDPNGNTTQLPDPMGERRMQNDNSRLTNETTRTNNDTSRLGIEQQKVDLEAKTNQRVQDKETRGMDKQKAVDVAAFNTVATSTTRMSNAIDDLLRNPGLNRIFGKTGGLVSPRLLGNDAQTAAANIDALKDQLMNETLQAIRIGSENGASGYGQLDKNEGEALRRQIASLDRSLPTSEARKSLLLIKEHIQGLEQRAQGIYEATHKESIFPGLPAGSKHIKTVDGKKVFLLPNGKDMVKED